MRSGAVTAGGLRGGTARRGPEGVGNPPWGRVYMRYCPSVAPPNRNGFCASLSPAISVLINTYLTGAMAPHRTTADFHQCFGLVHACSIAFVLSVVAQHGCAGVGFSPEQEGAMRRILLVLLLFGSGGVAAEQSTLDRAANRCWAESEAAIPELNLHLLAINNESLRQRVVADYAEAGLPPGQVRAHLALIDRLNDINLKMAYEGHIARVEKGFQACMGDRAEGRVGTEARRRALGVKSVKNITLLIQSIADNKNSLRGSGRVR